MPFLPLRYAETSVDAPTLSEMPHSKIRIENIHFFPSSRNKSRYTYKLPLPRQGSKNNPEDFLFLLSPINLPRYIFRLVIFWMIPFFHFYLSVLCVTLVRCSYMSRTYLHPAHCGRFNVSPSLCPVGVAAHPPSAVSRSSIGRLLPT